MSWFGMRDGGPTRGFRQGKRLIAGLQCRGTEPVGRVRWARGDHVVVPLHPVGKITNGHLVAGLQLALERSAAVDAHAVGAAEVAHYQIVVNLCDAAMPARDFARG